MVEFTVVMELLILIVYCYIRIFEFMDSITCPECGNICNEFSEVEEKVYVGVITKTRYIKCSHCNNKSEITLDEWHQF